MCHDSFLLFLLYGRVQESAARVDMSGDCRAATRHLTSFGIEHAKEGKNAPFLVKRIGTNSREEAAVESIAGHFFRSAKFETSP